MMMLKLRSPVSTQPLLGSAAWRQVRILIEGHTGSGRQILRGVVRYIRTLKPRWRLHVEPRPWGTRGPDWARDEGTICAVADQALVERLVSENHALVNCLAHYEELGITTVRTDDLAVGRMAARHLLDRGFERFVFWSSGDRSMAAYLRLQGMREELARVGYAPQPIPADWLPGPASRSHDSIDLPSALAEIGFPVALLCSHDTLGRLLSTELATAGVAVPEQVALLGVDNDELQCEISTPMLSSVDLPYEELGFRAAQRLDALLQGKPVIAKSVLLEPTGVVERQSTDIIAVADPLLSQAARFIREHACDPCSVEDVLEKLTVSRRWLEVQFRKRFGRTPHEELTRIRMERAMYLLRTSPMSIQLIAAHCGYSLVQNFGRAFKEQTGETPAVYRERHKPALDGRTVAT